MRFQCQRCGWCCRNKRITITYSDVKRWEKQGRWDILGEVSLIDYSKNPDVILRQSTGFYFEKTARLIPHPPCPFLQFEGKVASCKIYETRPKACRNNPEIIAKEQFNDWLGCLAFRRKWGIHNG